MSQVEWLLKEEINPVILSSYLLSYNRFNVHDTAKCLKYGFYRATAVLSAVYAVVVCLCVCVCHTPVMYQNG